MFNKKFHNKTTYEAWYGLKPSVGNFRIYGSLCYRNVPEQHRMKLDGKVQAMILVGYHSTCAYKLFSPIDINVVIIRDVEFDESKGWNWLNSMQKAEGASHTKTTLQDDKQVVEAEIRPI